MLSIGSAPHVLENDSNVRLGLDAFALHRDQTRKVDELWREPNGECLGRGIHLDRVRFHVNRTLDF